MQTLAQLYPATNSTMTAEILQQWQSPRGPQRALMAALAILQAVMLLVLAAVAGNTTNLVLARASARQREAAVRLALGASRWRVMRLMLTETTVLALGGAAIGVLIAIWGTEAMRAVPMPTPQGMQVSFFTSIDTTSLLFACALGLVAGIVIGSAAGVAAGPRALGCRVSRRRFRVRPSPAARHGAGAANRHRPDRARGRRHGGEELCRKPIIRSRVQARRRAACGVRPAWTRTRGIRRRQRGVFGTRARVPARTARRGSRGARDKRAARHPWITVDVVRARRTRTHRRRIRPRPDEHRHAGLFRHDGHRHRERA